MGQLLYSSRRTELKISHPADSLRGVFLFLMNVKKVCPAQQSTFYHYSSGSGYDISSSRTPFTFDLSDFSSQLSKVPFSASSK